MPSTTIHTTKGSEKVPLIAFVGTPNCGKSTLFNALTGLRQKVGNFPGVTVEPKEATLTHGSAPVRLVDLPGVYSLQAKSADERFTAQYLAGETANELKPDGIVLVADGTNLEKALLLFSQVASLSIPIIVVVTMIDAVKASGAVFDDITLSHELGVNVLCVVGSKGIGIENVREALSDGVSLKVAEANNHFSSSIEERVQWARQLCEAVLTRSNTHRHSEYIDRILLHPVGGLVTFIAVMIVFFEALFSWAQPAMGAIESLIAAGQSLVDHQIPAGLLQNFLSQGILGGVGSVVVFLPQIILLTLFVTVLEDCGYLARAAFLVDRIMGLFGLQGRSFIPLLGSFACAIPGIMSARIIPSDRDRITTILIAPLMTCSARIPVYTLLISACIPPVALLGFVSMQSAVMALLYALGLVAGLVVALAFKRTIFRSEPLHFLIEFPPYRVPSVRNVMRTTWARSKDFLSTAGSIILVVSIVLWALTEFPQADVPEATSAVEARRIQLESSAAGMIGKTIQPVFAPLGFDWKITVGLLGSFAARETFVSVMAQLFATDDSEGNSSLRSKLQASIALPTALSIIVFYVFALQCISTLAIIKRETGSWKWSAVAFSYTMVLAYTFSYLTYSVSRALLL